jgi:hypothetical protein
MYRLRPTLRLAQEVGGAVGRHQVLLGTLSVGASAARKTDYL